MENLVEIETPAGRMDTFVARPDDGKAHPAVVLLMDIWGLRQELFDLARRVAGQGYCAVLPNTYYRQGQVRYLFRNEQGRMRSFDTMDKEMKAKLHAHADAVTDAMVVEDAAALLTWLPAFGVSPGPVGSIGYCMGGRHVFAIAGHLPERFRANACLHGTRLVTGAPDSVHRLASRMRGELYCGFAELDPFTPPPTIAAVAAEMARHKHTVAYTEVVHAGADHGYALPDRDVYHHAAAERDWAQIFAMFQRQLAPAMA